MRSEPERVYIGLGGHAVAIDVASGNEVWRTKLKGADFVTVSLAGPRLLAGAGGELFCLDIADGTIVWRNKLKGLGMGPLAFTSTDDAVLEAALTNRRRAAAAAT